IENKILQKKILRSHALTSAFSIFVILDSSKVAFKDIELWFMLLYRGEKALCSWHSRSQDIMIQEEMDKNNSDTSSFSQSEIMAKKDSNDIFLRPT
ncbi:hypothetical protein Tco_1221826, partial [Tanacetum coccineum]